jgi:hypothetical protein
MTILMFALSLSIAFTRKRLIETLKAETVIIKKWGGRALIIIGLWLIILAVWADMFARIFPV